MDFLMVLGIIDSKQVDIFIYIVENTNQSNNTFMGTYKKIAADVGCSEPTIAKIMRKLRDNNFIKKMQKSTHFLKCLGSSLSRSAQGFSSSKMA